MTNPTVVTKEEMEVELASRRTWNYTFHKKCGQWLRFHPPTSIVVNLEEDCSYLECPCGERVYRGLGGFRRKAGLPDLPPKPKPPTPIEEWAKQVLEETV